ncbi:unnamed protein product [Boreogadus saida]
MSTNTLNPPWYVYKARPTLEEYTLKTQQQQQHVRNRAMNPFYSNTYLRLQVSGSPPINTQPAEPGRGSDYRTGPALRPVQSSPPLDQNQEIRVTFCSSSLAVV